MAEEYCSRMKAGERQIEGRSEWQTADGRRLVINASLRRVVGGEGNDLVLICGQDQTELIRQREELMAQRDFLAVVARATPSLLIAVERDGTVTVEGVNYAFRELTGYTDEEAIGAKFWDLVAPPELVDEVRRAFEEQVETGVSAEHETAWIGKSGNWRIIAWWLRPLGAFSGKFIVCGTDVTERNAQEAELRASRSRIVEAADDARMRLERNLHDGAQQRLVSLSLALRLAQARLRETPTAPSSCLPARRRSSSRRSPSSVSSPAASTRPSHRPRPAGRARGAGNPYSAPRRALRRSRGAPAGPDRGCCLLRRRGGADERREVRRGLVRSRSAQSDRTGASSSRSRTTASAAPIRLAGRACAASPTGSRRSRASSR